MWKTLGLSLSLLIAVGGAAWADIPPPVDLPAELPVELPVEPGPTDGGGDGGDAADGGSDVLSSEVGGSDTGRDGGGPSVDGGVATDSGTGGDAGRKPTPEDEGDCGCRVGNGKQPRLGLLPLLGGLGVAFVVARRRKSRR